MPHLPRFTLIMLTRYPHQQPVTPKPHLLGKRHQSFPGNPNWLLDSAHNTHAIAKITAELPKLVKDKEVAILLGLSDHNDLADLAPYLYKLREAIPCLIYLTSGFYTLSNYETHTW